MAFELPVIDLSIFGDQENISSLEGSNELKKIREACEEFGFFHVVNHGVDKDLIEKMDCASRDMFSLPEEVKSSAIYSTLVNTGYHPPTLGPDGKNSMPESMDFPGDSVLPNSIDQIYPKLWPHKNHHFREIAHAYKSNMMSLAQRITRLIMLSLGLDVSKHHNSDLFRSFIEGFLRMNFYHGSKSEEEPQNANTSIGHTDLGFLTILFQDDVGGLQIRTKEGIWINVKPLKESFVINLADCLQMWSNSRYRSAEHRVVYGGLKQREARLSIVFNFTFEGRAEIKAPGELINEEHPQKYKCATFNDIVARYVQFGPTFGGSNYFLI